MSFLDSYKRSISNQLRLCVGIDPSQSELNSWGLDYSPNGALKYGRILLDAADGLVSIVKPQVAYFEQFGAEGYRVLSDLVSEARERKLLVIADAKRGDIGSTIDAYARAWMGDDAPFRIDAITANPYLGLGSLQPMLSRARDTGTYVFVVARSSNPEGTSIQNHGTPPVWHSLLDDISGWIEKNDSQTVGVVVGATVIPDLELALSRLPTSLVLAPGIGKQGATVRDLMSIESGTDRVVASASRSISEAGPSVDSVKQAISSMLG